jgi:hypothetical protein
MARLRRACWACCGDARVVLEGHGACFRTVCRVLGVSCWACLEVASWRVARVACFGLRVVRVGRVGCRSALFSFHVSGLHGFGPRTGRALRKHRKHDVAKLRAQFSTEPCLLSPGAYAMLLNSASALAHGGSNTRLFLYVRGTSWGPRKGPGSPGSPGRAPEARKPRKGPGSPNWVSHRKQPCPCQNIDQTSHPAQAPYTTKLWNLSLQMDAKRPPSATFFRGESASGLRSCPRKTQTSDNLESRMPRALLRLISIHITSIS